MGPKQSSPEQPKEQEAHKINHPRFQSSKIVQDKEENDNIEIRLPVANEREYTTWA